MSRPDEHIFQHPKTHVFWFRRVIPPRLRPHMPDVPGLFPSRATRVQFVRTLATKDRRRANAAALPIRQAVHHAFVEAERRLKATRAVPLPPKPDAVANLQLVIPIRREDALAAIERWCAKSLAEAELRHFNSPPLDSHAAYRAAEAAAPLLNALAEITGQVGTGAPWPADGDATLAAALSGQGVPASADQPAVPRLRRDFADAWLQVLRAEDAMRFGLFPSDPPASTAAPPAAQTPFLTHLAAWETQLGMKSRQAGEYVAAVTAFGAHHPGLTLEGTEKRHGQAWVEALAEQGLAEGTIVRKLCAARNYWGWLQAQGKVAEEHRPFNRLRMPGTVKKAPGPDDEPRPFARAEMVRLWRAVRDAPDPRDRALADLIRLAAYSGARIESLCVLNRALVRVDPDTSIRFLKFHDKTDAGVREVPVHPAIGGLVDRLLRDSRDGFLVPAGSINRHGERSPALGKRFTRLKRRLGFGQQHTFHSIRKTVATLFENSGCPETIAADIIGHEKPGLTYGLYSGGASLAVKLDWLTRAIDYGDAGFRGAG